MKRMKNLYGVLLLAGTFLALCQLIFSQEHLNVSRVIPVSVDRGQVRVLLAKFAGINEWQVPGGQFQSEQFDTGRSVDAGMWYLASQTNNLYNQRDEYLRGGVPWTHFGNSWYIAFPVPFIPGRDLYTRGRGPGVEDFAWVTPEQIYDGGFARQIQDRYEYQFVDRELAKVFRDHWDRVFFPEIQNRLSAPPIAVKQQVQQSAPIRSIHQQQQISQPIPPQPQPAAGPLCQVHQQTSDSIGIIQLPSWLDSQNTGLQKFTNKNGDTKFARRGYIYFYRRGEPYYEFANFAEGWPFIYKDITWPTSEHAFQAMKSNDSQEWQHIASLPTPRAAFDYGRNLSKTKRTRVDWHTVKTQLMLEIVRAKFTDHSALSNLLCETGNSIIVENTFLADYDDPDWGNGLNDNGKNLLGRVLMRIRAELMGIVHPDTPFPQ